MTKAKTKILFRSLKYFFLPRIHFKGGKRECFFNILICFVGVFKFKKYKKNFAK